MTQLAQVINKTRVLSALWLRDRRSRRQVGNFRHAVQRVSIDLRHLRIPSTLHENIKFGEKSFRNMRDACLACNAETPDLCFSQNLKERSETSLPKAGQRRHT